MADVLSEFARTLATDFPIQGILDHLVHRIVDVLPITAAGVTLISPTTAPRYVAASDESALRFERLQTDLGEGPCVAAFQSDSYIAIPDLATDHRFPEFARQALAGGLAGVFTFPLRDGHLGLGALDLYRETPGPLGDRDLDAAQTLADVATAYLLNAQARVDLETMSAAEREALERLRVVDRTKTEFLATVIHELRTPLASISGYTQLLEDGVAGRLSVDQHKMVEAIDRNGERLSTLADDLLALARLEEAPDRYVDVDLIDVVVAAQTALQLLIDRRTVDVTFEVPSVPTKVRGDARMLERLVTNLLTNAVKFTEDGGWVRCALTSNGTSAQLQVSDNGIGIPESEQPALFGRFFRSSTAQQHGIPGSGLGLSIVETIAHNHGGSVSVTSVHEEGTTFVVELPLVPPG